MHCIYVNINFPSPLCQPYEYDFCILMIHTAGTDPYQGKFVDLDINDLHLSVGHLTAVAFVLLVGLEVRAEPQELKGSIWIMAVIHLVQTLDVRAHTQTRKLKNFTEQLWLLHIQTDAGRCRAYQQTH